MHVPESLPDRTPLRVLLQFSRPLLRVLYVGLALVGAPASRPATLLVLAPVLGGIAAGLLAAIYYSWTERLPSRRTLAATGLAAAAFPSFAAGIDLLEGAGGYAGLVVIGLATVVGAHAVHTLDAGGSTAGSTVGPAAAEDTTCELLAVLPPQMLLQEWHDAMKLATDRRPCGPPDPAAVHFRRAVLAELQRREPTAEAVLDEHGSQEPSGHATAAMIETQAEGDHR